MNTPYSYEHLNKHMRAGQVYRRDMLLPHSKALDRDLDTLVEKGLLKKLAMGLYYKPAQSLFGALPPKDDNLVSCFLRDNRFLMYSWNQYNALGVGLTQLYNRVIVLNHKRHGVFKLGNKEFDFRRSGKGFPAKMTPEFLLVDLVNNLKELAEDTSVVKENIYKNLARFDQGKLVRMVREYGKISTKRFFEKICHREYIR
ncbi:MAG: hypothetical protein A3F43_01990 [Gammaproteobacteria bacterium RIFCSPHIGHO2_12_FULL_42_10]|nr:MAG: hypothetical protein A3F43_01990 [Gammaproteobacteria bacterium RIFCSPHIGHO2_12_FULL_42_10]